jgi:hypothetical protein
MSYSWIVCRLDGIEMISVPVLPLDYSLSSSAWTFGQDFSPE